MKTFVIGDLHNHVEGIEDFLQENPHDSVIFLGDYFDSWGDNRYMAQNTAEWLVQSLKHENRIHLMGNHDMPYRFPANEYVRCPGWTPDKQRAVSSVMRGKYDYWKKLKLAHFQGKFIFSHAGLTEKLFNVGLNGPDLKAYEKTIEDALANAEAHQNARDSVYVQYFDPSYDGITWIRPEVLKLLPGITQVFGHTITCEVLKVPVCDTMPIVYENNGGIGWNIDCANRWFGVLEDGEFYCQHRVDKTLKITHADLAN